MQTISYAEIAARMKAAGVPTGTPPPSPAPKTDAPAPKPATPMGKRAAIDYVQPVDDPAKANFNAIAGIAMYLLCKHEHHNGTTEFVNYNGMRWRIVSGKGEMYVAGRGWMPDPDAVTIKAALSALKGETLPVYRPTILSFDQVFKEASRAFLPADKHPVIPYDPMDD